AQAAPSNFVASAPGLRPSPSPTASDSGACFDVRSIKQRDQMIAFELVSGALHRTSASNGSS
ncbi:MAG: hypothetical protein ACREDR_21975, partial [Blastocatellia bacterium]